MRLTLVCGVTLKMTASLINNAKKIQVEVGGTAPVSLELQKRFLNVKMINQQKKFGLCNPTACF